MIVDFVVIVKGCFFVTFLSIVKLRNDSLAATISIFSSGVWKIERGWKCVCMFIYMYMRLICVGEYVYMYVCVYIRGLTPWLLISK